MIINIDIGGILHLNNYDLETNRVNLNNSLSSLLVDSCKFLNNTPLVSNPIDY